MKPATTRVIHFSCIFLILLYKSVMAIEEPSFKILDKYDSFEIREYAPYLIAEVEINTSFDEASTMGFQILFKYISGDNQKQEEITMTTPVNQMNSENAGEKIEMTLPVAQKSKLKSAGKYIISFVMHSKYNMETIPVPKDQRIKIIQVPKKIMAVREYSGTWSEENYRENEALLNEELNKNNIKMIAEPVFARYNPPFWPWFLRRNEVLIEIESSSAK